MTNPDGMFLCRIPATLVDQGWQDAVAFRFVKLSDEAAVLEVTNDLELATRPDGEQ